MTTHRLIRAIKWSGARTIRLIAGSCDLMREHSFAVDNPIGDAPGMRPGSTGGSWLLLIKLFLIVLNILKINKRNNFK